MLNIQFMGLCQCWPGQEVPQSFSYSMLLINASSVCELTPEEAVSKLSHSFEMGRSLHTGGNPIIAVPGANITWETAF